MIEKGPDGHPLIPRSVMGMLAQQEDLLCRLIGHLIPPRETDVSVFLRVSGVIRAYGGRTIHLAS